MKDSAQMEILWNSSVLFIFILIVSGNYLGALLPCKVQDFIEHNMYMRHFLGYMTMLFFVILTMPDLFINNIFTSSISLYLYFLFFSKTYWKIWVAIIIILSIIYLINTIYDMRRTKSNLSGISYDDINDEANKSLFLGYEDVFIDMYAKHMPNIRTAVIALILLLTLIGFLIYLGNKKKEFGKNFNFIKFLFGNPVCKHYTPPIKSYIEEIKYAFK